MYGDAVAFTKFFKKIRSWLDKVVSKTLKCAWVVILPALVNVSLFKSSDIVPSSIVQVVGAPKIKGDASRAVERPS